MPAPPSPRPGPTIGREELRRRREEKLAELLGSATRALERNGKDDKFDEAQELVDQATLLSPDDPRVVALWERLDAERPARVKALLDDARRDLQARSLESAAACIERAVDLQPDSRAALELHGEVRARLSAGSRRAQAGWRIAAGAVIGIGFLAAATLSLIPEMEPAAESGALVVSAGDPMENAGFEPAAPFEESLGGEPGIGETGTLDSEAGLTDLQGGADPETTAATGAAGRGRIAGASLAALTGGGEPEPAAARAPPGRPVAPIRPASGAAAGAPLRESAPPASAAAPSPAAPIIVVRLCDEDVACGALRVHVQPAATILFNGIRVGAGAQGMLRLPAGRHQIRLRSDEHEFRRMITIARGAPATLEVDLADEGLPLLPQ